MRTWLLIAAALYASPALAGLEDVTACLDRNDVGCAQDALTAMGATSSHNPDVLAATAEVHFYAGEYPEAFDTLQTAVEAGYPDPYERLALYERTLYTTAGWTEADRGRFRIRYAPGVDAILVDDGARVLDATVARTVPLIGEPPPGRTIVELFPDGRSFIAASSLTWEDVKTTGIVGLSKWSRLLVTSPRAHGRGYAWQDTASHEYLHLVIAHNTNDRAPVWLQEGIAKYLDGRWRSGADTYTPTVYQQGLLAAALHDHNLVTFEEMHPSLAKLPTADRASLAYAQLATLLQFSFLQGGDDILLRTLPRVAAGEDPRVALAQEAGFQDLAGLLAGWEAWLRRQTFLQREIAALPTVVEGGDDIETDPVLSGDENLARWVRLGDLLLDRDHPRAALVEYAKAVPAEGPHSPLTAARVAQANLALGDTTAARVALRRSLEDYPSFTLSHTIMGQIHQHDGHPQQAVASYENAVALNPFDWNVQQALVTLYDQLGDASQSAAHAAALTILQEGGEGHALVAIHERHGDVVMPRDARPAQAQGLVGSEAPHLDVVTLAGERVLLSDHQGQVVVLDFWATWCGPCRRAIPALGELFQAKKSDGLTVVGVTDEEENAIRPFLRRNDIPYTIGRDATAATKRAYGVSSLPTMVVIGRDGIITDVITGWSEGNHARLAQDVETALSAE